MNTKFLPISVVVTVKNDEAGIARLMEALARQTVGPDEVVVVRAEEYGNCSRGRGRNIGVKMARNEVIAVTDAGCRPHKDWLNKLYKCYKSYKKEEKKDKKEQRDKKGEGKTVVAGGYRAEARTELQRVMGHFLAPVDYFKDSPWHTPGRILFTKRLPRSAFGGTRNDGFVYLPASRSIMFTKKAWETVGGYPEEAVSGGEDLEFARRLVQHPEVKMIYCPQAVVDWEAPATLGEFFRDIVKHTRGNVEVGYWPHLWRNLTVVLRWMGIGIWPWLGVAYLGWIVGKGIKIIKVIKIINIAQIIIVQLAADGGVILGLILGISGILGNIIHTW